MVMYPLDYLGMNHETIFTYICSALALVLSVEFGVILAVYGSLCGHGAVTSFLREVIYGLLLSKID